MNVFKIAKFLQKGNKGYFEAPVNEQLAYLDGLGNASSDIERSYKQFLCQEYFVPTWKRFLWWVVSVAAIPFLLIILYLRGLRVRPIKKIDTIAENRGMTEIIPLELSSKYDLEFGVWHSGVGLNGSDIHYIFRRIIGWRQPYFMMKSILRIASFSPMITKFSPERIIQYGEYSFCSSMLTDYFHTRGVKNINVQHGEKLMFIRDSFFHFDECYVWGDYYVKMFVRMKAEPNQFIVSVPPSLNINIEEHNSPSCYADYKYYLASESEDDIRSIVASMAFAKREGKTVKFRIHPRYTDLNILKKYVPESEIELPSKVNILDSISNMEYAVGCYTTVLLQACLSGKKVIINDVTFQERYGQLKEYGYILAKDEIEKLSQRL